MGRVTIDPTSYGEIKVVGSYGHVFVGKYCSIADGVKTIMVGHNPQNISTYPFNRKGYETAAKSRDHPIKYGDVVIGNDVWIGYNATIFGSVAISDGTIIAAGSVVTKSTMPYSIVAGVPAKKIRYRFDWPIVSKLLQICWWDWEEGKIRENAGLLCSEKIEEFLKLHWKKYD